MSPPGRTAATQAPTSGRMERQERFLSPRVVAREAAKVLADLGLDVRPAAVRVLVTRFINEGHTSTTGLRSWVLSYHDPTGEDAVRNVMRNVMRGAS